MMLCLDWIMPSVGTGSIKTLSRCTTGCGKGVSPNLQRNGSSGKPLVGRTCYHNMKTEEFSKDVYSYFFFISIIYL